MKFRKIPLEVEAIQLNGRNGQEICAWADNFKVRFHTHGLDGQHRVLIETPEGLMTAMPGDWVIRGIKGEYYPCKEDIFAASYEVVTDNASAPVEPVTADEKTKPVEVTLPSDVAGVTPGAEEAHNE